jgi:hypothetical protein
MQGVPLKQLVAELGPAKVGKMLGVSHQGITKAVEAGREILITVLPDGKAKGTELSDFPKAKKKAAPD